MNVCNGTNGSVFISSLPCPASLDHPAIAHKRPVVRRGAGGGAEEGSHSQEARQQLRPANNDDRNKDRPVCVPE
jgi:hypothetical protein